MRIRLRLGPLPPAEALVWTADTLDLFDAVEGDPRLPFALPVEALVEMRAVVTALRARASAAGQPFFWDCETTLPELKTLITYWLNLGKLSERTLDRIGGRYSGEVGERFHAALLTSLLAQLEAVDPVYAERLRTSWERPTEATVVDLRSPAASSAARA